MKLRFRTLLSDALAVLTMSARGTVVAHLDATGLPTGALTIWDNLADANPANDFVRGGTGTSGVGPVGTPAVQAVTLDATGNWYVGPEAPVGMTGAGPRSIEVWVLNPAFAATCSGPSQGFSSFEHSNRRDREGVAKSGGEFSCVA